MWQAGHRHGHGERELWPLSVTQMWLVLAQNSYGSDLEQIVFISLVKNALRELRYNSFKNDVKHSIFHTLFRSIEPSKPSIKFTYLTDILPASVSPPTSLLPAAVAMLATLPHLWL